MKNESTVQDEIIIQLSRLGVTVMRNNVGAFRAENGRVVRYGLMNESKEINRTIKSSDLIGITPVQIESRHIGKTLGIFTAIETKKESWKFNPNNHRDIRQLAFINHVIGKGGIAGFCNHAITFMEYFSEKK